MDITLTDIIQSFSKEKTVVDFFANIYEHFIRYFNFPSDAK